VRPKRKSTSDSKTQHVVSTWEVSRTQELKIDPSCLK